MASTTPNIGLTLPTGAEKVSRQIINDNNTIIDGKMGAVPGGQNLQGEIDALNSKITPGSWTALNSTYGVYYMKVSGILFVKCIYNNSDIPSTLLGTLPAGYRPMDNVRVRNYGGDGYMIVNTDGTVYVSSTTWVNCTLVSPCSV